MKQCVYILLTLWTALLLTFIFVDAQTSGNKKQHNKALQLTARKPDSQEIFSFSLNADRAPQLKAKVSFRVGHNGRISKCLKA